MYSLWKIDKVRNKNVGWGLFIKLNNLYLMIQSNSLIVTQHFCIDIYTRIKWWKIDKMAPWIRLESQKMMEKLAIPHSNLEV